MAIGTGKTRKPKTFMFLRFRTEFGLLGSLGSLLEASWAPVGASWGSLGALLGRLRSWGHLGGDRSKKGGSLIRFAPLECLESPLGVFLRPTSFQNLMKINVCCFLAFSLLEPSWAILGASWGYLGGLLEASWAPLGASWAALGALLGAFGALLGPSWRRSIKEGGGTN